MNPSIHPSSAAASAAADAASVLRSPSVLLRAGFQVQDPEAVVFWSPDGVRDASGVGWAGDAQLW